jgi:hypothetical protein
MALIIRGQSKVVFAGRLSKRDRKSLEFRILLSMNSMS